MKAAFGDRHVLFNYDFWQEGVMWERQQKASGLAVERRRLLQDRHRLVKDIVVIASSDSTLAVWSFFSALQVRVFNSRWKCRWWSNGPPISRPSTTIRHRAILSSSKMRTIKYAAVLRDREKKQTATMWTCPKPPKRIIRRLCSATCEALSNIRATSQDDKMITFPFKTRPSYALMTGLMVACWLRVLH